MFLKKKSIIIILFFILFSSTFIQALNKNQKNNNLSAVRLVHLSKESMANKNRKQGFNYALKAVEADPAYSPAWKQLGRIYMLKGNYPKALECFQTVLDLTPEESDVQNWILSSIEQLLNRSDYPEVEKVLASWENKSNNIGAKGAISAMRKIVYGKLDEAEQILTEVEFIKPEVKSLYALTWVQLGMHYLRINEYDKGISALNKSLEIKPNWIPSLRELGWAYRRKGENKKAADEWNKILEILPNNSRVLEWVVKARIDDKDYNSALISINNLLKIQGNNKKALSLKLMILYLLNKKDEIKYLEKEILKLKNGEKIISLSKVEIFISNNNFKDACSLLEKLRKKYPNDPKLLKVLEKTYLNWSSAGTSKEALYPMEHLVRLAPSNPSYWRDYGWSLWMNNKKEEAIKAWDTSIKNHLPDKERLIFLVIAQIAEDNRIEQAISLFKKWSPGSKFLPLGLSLIKNTRFRGAKVILKAALNNGENPETTGFYLAFAEANADECSLVPEHLKPFINNFSDSISDEKLKIFLDTLNMCTQEDGIIDIFENRKIQNILSLKPSFDKQLTDIMIAKAVDLRHRGKHKKSLLLFKEILQRDPNRPDIWAMAVRLAEDMKNIKEAKDIMRDVLLRSTSAIVKEGIRAKIALDNNNLEEAVKHFYKSLNAGPNQPDLRIDLFNVLLKLYRFDEARKQIDWFETKIEVGDVTTKSILADMYYEIGEKDKAYELWQELYMTYPNTAVYAVGAANAMFNTCNSDEALDILEQFLSNHYDSNAYELYADILLSKKLFKKALKITDKALKKKIIKGILRARAEIAEILKEYKIALKTSEDYLKIDPSNASILRIKGDSLLFLEKLNKARKFYKRLVKSNNQFLPAILGLKDLSSMEEKTELSLKYIKTIVKQRPWDLMAKIKYAVALAENDEYREAYKILRTQVKRDINEVVPVLIYKDITECDYYGKISLDKVIAQLTALKANGYHFILPPEFNNLPSKEKRVIIIFQDPSPRILKKLDKEIDKLGIRAVLGFNTNSPLKKLPDILKSGHWIIASTGPLNFQRLPIDSKGTVGNPFTHRLFINNNMENYKEMFIRVDKLLRRASNALGKTYKHIFIYPEGDYGQYSLNTNEKTIKTLYNAVKQNFNYAIAYDTNGFADINHDNIRLCGKLVPPLWTTRDLMIHLTENNPLVKARLELAKILYWQSQHERANIKFKDAKKVGANIIEVLFNWGSNLDMEGDLPNGLKKLRQANKLAPKDKRIKKALKRAENRKHFFIKPYYDTWEDSDNRSYWGYGGSIEKYLSDNFQLNIFGNRNHWERAGYGFEEGTRYGGDFKYHFAEERWFDFKLWYLDMDTAQDHVGGQVSFHIPNAKWGGHFDIEAAHEEIETVEAIRDKIYSNRFTLFTYSRIQDMWDLFVNISYKHNTDSNDIIFLYGRFYRRFKEWPFLGIGYLFRFGDSDFDPPQYYAPDLLQQHQIYGTSRGEFGFIHYSVTAQAGYARERETDWKFVWGLRAEVDLTILPILVINGSYIRQDSPRYKMTEYKIGFTLRIF
jgi:tetratricopeptide (TPR) repeat protein